MRRGRGRGQRPPWISYRQRQTSIALQGPRDSPAVSQTGEHFQSFAIRGVRRRRISLETIDGPQIGEGTCGPPTVPNFAKNRKRSFVEPPGGSHVVLFARDIALLVD